VAQEEARSRSEQEVSSTSASEVRSSLLVEADRVVGTSQEEVAAARAAASSWKPRR
jgi:hypothetical protein